MSPLRLAAILTKLDELAEGAKPRDSSALHEAANLLDDFQALLEATKARRDADARIDEVLARLTRDDEAAS